MDVDCEAALAVAKGASGRMTYVEATTGRRENNASRCKYLRHGPLEGVQGPSEGRLAGANRRHLGLDRDWIR